MPNLSPQASLAGDVPVLGPIGVAVTGLTTVAAPAIAADICRHGLIFHNPSATIAKRIAPAGMALAGGTGGMLVYPQSDLFLLAGNDEYFNINAAWNAVTDNNSDGTLTIFNFTDANPSVPAPMMRAALSYVVPITSPNGIAVTNLTTASAQVIAANPVRRGIIFSNPGVANKYVCPANLAASVGAGSWTILPGQQRMIIARGRVRVNCAWNGLSANNADPDLTILEML
jgi:hypothetical protein